MLATISWLKRGIGGINTLVGAVLPLGPKASCVRSLGRGKPLRPTRGARHNHICRLILAYSIRTGELADAAEDAFFSEFHDVYSTACYNGLTAAVDRHWCKMLKTVSPLQHRHVYAELRRDISHDYTN
jgi:predicted metal-dependent peptidase